MQLTVGILFQFYFTTLRKVVKIAPWFSHKLCQKISLLQNHFINSMLGTGQNTITNTTGGNRVTFITNRKQNFHYRHRLDLKTL